MIRWTLLLAAGLALCACQAGSGDGNATQRAEDASGTAAPTPPAADAAPGPDGAPPPTAPAQSSGSQSR